MKRDCRRSVMGDNRNRLPSAQYHFPAGTALLPARSQKTGRDRFSYHSAGESGQLLGFGAIPPSASLLVKLASST